MLSQIIILLVSALFGCGFAVQVKSCSDKNMVTINWIDVNPSPVTLPGDITLSLSVTLHKPLKGNLDADLTISRKLGFMWIDLPCKHTPKGRLGSCTYSDICNTVMRNGTICPSLLTDNNIPCTCEVPAQTYTIPQTIIPLDLSTLGLPSFATAGNYQASLRVTERSTMTEVICLDITVEIKSAQTSNIFGSLGRFLVNLFN